jgi:hypothetical protein
VKNPGLTSARARTTTAVTPLDYVYEVTDKTLTIWAGSKGSPAFFRGKFSADGRIGDGDWQYEGGGYHSTMTRVH